MSSQLSSSDRPINQKQNHDLKSKPSAQKQETILCPHCQRTASNGIKCQGICVADSSY